MRPTIDTRKLAQLGTFNDDLDRKYGKINTPSRDEFDAKSKAWYCAECLKQARKKAGLTQKEVAEKVGKKREYIALIERGETESSYMNTEATHPLPFTDGTSNSMADDSQMTPTWGKTDGGNLA